ncbi:hypothetical protein BDN72DRAFT_898029 [Pluteus cervinus]|uniref:Uncharacterized protein n=1 Tax=Pluteus cervinus TaxID=181527 RepID=A0ACD3AS44_9AGAR|nr:hypothetical protein BDN72DRAFT_898029 [Pluteus cervinus]
MSDRGADFGQTPPPGYASQFGAPSRPASPSPESGGEEGGGHDQEYEDDLEENDEESDDDIRRRHRRTAERIQREEQIEESVTGEELTGRVFRSFDTAPRGLRAAWDYTGDREQEEDRLEDNRHALARHRAVRRYEQQERRARSLHHHRTHTRSGSVPDAQVSGSQSHHNHIRRRNHSYVAGLPSQTYTTIPPVPSSLTNTTPLNIRCHDGTLHRHYPPPGQSEFPKLPEHESHYSHLSRSQNPSAISHAGHSSTTLPHNYLLSRTTFSLNQPTNHVSLSRKTTTSSPSKTGLSSFRVFRGGAKASSSTGNCSSSASWIKGKFTINPYLHIPAALLAPISEDVEGCGLRSRPRDQGVDNRRKNLSLEVENGGIDVDVLLVADPGADEGLSPMGLGRDDKTVQTSLELTVTGGERSWSRMFPLIARIHTLDILRPPFRLILNATDGYVSAHLPRSFQGLVAIQVSQGNLNSHISLSKAFEERSLILNETGTSRSFFLGEVPVGGWDRGEEDWNGDRMDVRVEAGKVRIQLLGEKDLDGWRNLGWRWGL